MQDTKEQLIGRLARLDMSSRGASSGLVFTSELFDKDSSISFYERIALERAHRVSADAVYFKHYAESTRAPVAQIYIFDFSNKEQINLGEIHKNVWSSTDVRLYFIVTKSEIKIYNSAKPVGFDYAGNYRIEPYDVLKLVGEAADRFELYSSNKFDTGEFWQDSKNEFSYNNTAYERLVTELKNARRHFLNGIHLETDIANKLLVLSILVIADSRTVQPL